MSKSETDGGYARYEKACSEWQYEQRRIAEKERDQFRTENEKLKTENKRLKTFRTPHRSQCQRPKYRCAVA